MSFVICPLPVASPHLPVPLLLFSLPSASLTDVLKLTRQIGIFLRDARIRSLKIATICAAHELKTREVRLRSQLASRALRTESVAAKFYERQGRQKRQLVTAREISPSTAAF